MYFSEMGADIFTIGVGKPPVTFAVHKNLLSTSGQSFHDMASLKLPEGKFVVLHNEEPKVFKLFLDYLYQKRVPRVSPNTNSFVQAERLKELCQLYAFADKHGLNRTFRNKIMDVIQDGFLTIGALPELPLVKHIYEHTSPGSILRKFCAASLVFTVRRPSYTNEDGFLPSLLNEVDEIMDDFLLAVRDFDFAVEGRDPRIRDCQGEPTCSECAGVEGGMRGKLGFWPCYFHLHLADNTTAGLSKGVNGNGATEVDQGCYLWNY